MVFSTGASAFLHLDEHKHGCSVTLADTEAHQTHSSEADHAHHFNLHMVGDLVEHNFFPVTRSAHLAKGDYQQQLISRTYLPATPPPNA